MPLRLPNGVDLLAAIISLAIIVATLLLTFLAQKAAAIIIAVPLLIAVIASFAFFSYDMLIRVGNRNTAAIFFFALSHVFSVIVIFGVLERWTGLRYLADATEDRHSLGGAIYFSVVTWTTVGYGDIVPGPNTRMLIAIEALIGYVAMALLIALFSAMFQSWNRSRRQQ